MSIPDLILIYCFKDFVYTSINPGGGTPSNAKYKLPDNHVWESAVNYNNPWLQIDMILSRVVQGYTVGLKTGCANLAACSFERQIIVRVGDTVTTDAAGAEPLYTHNDVCDDFDGTTVFSPLVHVKTRNCIEPRRGRYFMIQRNTNGLSGKSGY